MNSAELQLKLAQHLLSFLPPPEREKIEVARRTLKQMSEIDPFVMEIAIGITSLENTAKKTKGQPL